MLEDLFEGVVDLLHTHESEPEVDGDIADDVQCLRTIDAHLHLLPGTAHQAMTSAESGSRAITPPSRNMDASRNTE